MPSNIFSYSDGSSKKDIDAVKVKNESEIFTHFYPKGYLPYKIKWFDLLLAALIFIITLTGYIRTLTPSVCAGDSGEFTTTVYNMGSSHAPGYPLYGIIGKIFTYLPFGDIAYRMNLFSAAAAAGAVMFLFLISIKLLGLNRDNGHPLITVHIPAVLISFIFAFSKTHWSQAIMAEVYALNVFLIAAMTFVTLQWYEEMVFFRGSPSLHFADRKTLLMAFLMGLSLTNHQLPVWSIVAFVLVLFPTTVMLVISDRPKKFYDQFTRRLGIFILLVFLGVISLTLFMKFAYFNRLIFPKDTPYILTSIFLVPGFLTFYTVGVKIFKPETNWIDRFFELITYAVWLFIIAMTVYLYLVVRAKALAPLSDPKPLSWGDTQTLDILFNHMLRRQYGMGGGGDYQNLAGQFGAVMNFILTQYGWLHAVIGIFGMAYALIKERVWAIYLIASMLLLDIMLIKFVNFQIDPRTLSFQEVMYIQQFMFIAVFIGFGYQLLIDGALWIGSGKKLPFFSGKNKEKSKT